MISWLTRKNNYAKILLWIILTISLVLKLVLILKYGKLYDLNSDDRSYLNSAAYWLKTGIFTYNTTWGPLKPILPLNMNPTVFIMPLFPAFIAIFIKIFGAGFATEQIIRIAQAFVVTGALYILFLIGSKIFSEKKAILAVFITACYPPLYMISALILTEAIFTFALMLLVFSALKAMETFSYKWASLFAIFWAMTVYIRPTIALWPGVFLILLFIWNRGEWKLLLTRGLVGLFVFLALLSPWWIRNYKDTGQFIPLTESSGNPLLLGTYINNQFPSLQEQQNWHRTNNKMITEKMDTQMAMKRIKSGFKYHPLNYLKWYTIGKYKLFWYDIFYWIPIPHVPFLFVRDWHYYAIIYPGFLGILLTLRDRRALVISSLLAYMTFIHSFYFVFSRYSVTLIPLLSLFAAFFIASVSSKIASKSNLINIRKKTGLTL